LMFQYVIFAIINALDKFCQHLINLKIVITKTILTAL